MRHSVRELIFRLRNGFWCMHSDTDGAGGAWPTFTPWLMVNSGANKVRWCSTCGRTEWV